MQFNKPLAVYAVKDKDEKALSRAASGGAFSVLARPIISLGGVVFGAKTHDGGMVQHAAAESLDEISQLQGSAYVQSDIEGVFQSIVEFLRDGRIVLFVGLPCQCAAVLSYVRVKLPKGLDSEKLFLCDLVCHGARTTSYFRLTSIGLVAKGRATMGFTRSNSERRERVGASTTTTTTTTGMAGSTRFANRAIATLIMRLFFVEKLTGNRAIGARLQKAKG